MRKFWAVSLAAVISAAAAGAAHAGDSYLSAAGGWSRFSDFNVTQPVWQGRGTSQFALDGMWQFQGDAVLTQQSLDEWEPGLTYNTIDLAAHLFHRKMEHGLLGVFAQFSTNNEVYPYGSDSNTEWYGGVEGLTYWSNFSLYGQVAAVSQDYGYGTSNGFAANLRGRLFLSPQLFIEAKATFQRISDGVDSLDSTLFGAAIEYQCPTSPFSVFARYSHVSQKFEFASEADTTDRILLGAKWNFGGKTLWQRETDGAALDPIEAMSVIVRAR
jgi:hypothetical protein